jgi:archaellum component FlaC
VFFTQNINLVKSKYNQQLSLISTIDAIGNIPKNLAEAKAATKAVEELSTNIANLIASLKKQIIPITSIVIKIQKKSKHKKLITKVLGL